MSAPAPRDLTPAAARPRRAEAPAPARPPVATPPAAVPTPSEPGPGRLGLSRPALGLVLLALCVAPFALVLAVSLGVPEDGAAWDWGLSLQNYRRVFVGLDWPETTSRLYLARLGWSLAYAALASVVAVAFAFPLAWAIARRSRRTQTIWLVFLLASLSLSEVFVVMGWDILMSNRSGLPMLFRESGLTDALKATPIFDWLREQGLASPRDVRFKTSVPLSVLVMAYLVFPYAVILLYPALSRIDPAMMEAARTMGARPGTVMRTVVIPQVRLPLLGAVLLLFVFLLGAYVVVTQFADPARHTLTVSIYESVRGATLNAPFGAAQAVVLLVAAATALLAASGLARLAERAR